MKQILIVEDDNLLKRWPTIWRLTATGLPPLRTQGQPPLL